MRRVLTGVVAMLGAAAISSAAGAQTLKMMKSLEEKLGEPEPA